MRQLEFQDFARTVKDHISDHDLQNQITTFAIVHHTSEVLMQMAQIIDGQQKRIKELEHHLSPGKESSKDAESN